MTDVYINKINETYTKVISDPGIAAEIKEYFSYYPKNYKQMPQYRAGKWNGKMSLFNMRSRTILTGLIQEVIEFCEKNDYTYTVNGLKPAYNFSVYDADQFIKSLNLPSSYEVRYYQRDALIEAVRYSRRFILSPTASGKSLIFYLLDRFYRTDTLLIVPTTNLVNQMYTDFAEYSDGLSNTWTHKIYEGQDKETHKRLVITTWQSIYRLPDEWFKRFKLVLGDEAHGFKASSLISIIEKLAHTGLRFGLSGTLDGSTVSERTLKGLFGNIYRTATTKELIDQKFLAPLTIKIIVLQHSNAPFFSNRNDEQEYLMAHDKRNKFITKLALSLDGNSIVYFRFIEKHGDRLNASFQALREPHRPFYYITGETDPLDREDIRGLIEQSNNAILAASLGTFSTGANIKLINSILFTMMTKAQIQVLQSIGRGLRTHADKTGLVVYDIVDDLMYPGIVNKGMQDLAERLKIYKREKFPFKIYNIGI